MQPSASGSNQPVADGNNGAYLGAAVAAILMWSTSFVATKIAYQTFTPLTLGATRFLIATLLLGGLALAKRQLHIPDKRQTFQLALSGFLGITLYFSMENIGLSLTSASNAALICASYPAITIVLERILYGKPFTAMRAVGVCLAILGVYLVAGLGGKAESQNGLVGNIILILTGFAWAFYNFVTRGVVNQLPALTVSLYQTAFGTLFFLPLACLEYQTWVMPTAWSLGTLLYLGTLCSVAAFLLYNYGLRRLSAGAAVTLINLVPVFGVLLSVVVLNETVVQAQVAGGAIVIVGVVLSVRGDGKRNT